MSPRTSNALATATSTTLAKALDIPEATWQIVRSQVAPPEAPEEAVALLFARCKQVGADPMGRLLYIVNRRSKKRDSSEYVDNWRIESTIDFFRSAAEDTGEYDGQAESEWCGDDAAWVDVWLRKEPPTASRAKVYRKGRSHNPWVVARFEDYKQGGPTWEKMAPLMIAKCAEALAFRKAFPQQLNGIYVAEEMQQANDARTVYPASAPNGATDTVALPSADQTPEDPEAAARAAKAHERAENPLTVTDLRKSYEVLHLLGEQRALGAYLSDCGDKWLRPGAKPLKERSQSKTMLSAEEVARANEIIQADIAARRAPLPETETHEGEVLTLDEQVIYCSGCGAQTSPAANRERHKDDCTILDPAESPEPDLPKPTEGDLTQLAIGLLNRFARNEDAKSEWLYAVLGVDSIDKIETRTDVQLALKEIAR